MKSRFNVSWNYIFMLIFKSILNYKFLVNNLSQFYYILFSLENGFRLKYYISRVINKIQVFLTNKKYFNNYSVQTNKIIANINTIYYTLCITDRTLSRFMAIVTVARQHCCSRLQGDKLANL